MQHTCFAVRIALHLVKSRIAVQLKVWPVAFVVGMVSAKALKP